MSVGKACTVFHQREIKFSAYNQLKLLKRKISALVHIRFSAGGYSSFRRLGGLRWQFSLEPIKPVLKPERAAYEAWVSRRRNLPLSTIRSSMLIETFFILALLTSTPNLCLAQTKEYIDSIKAATAIEALWEDFQKGNLVLTKTELESLLKQIDPSNDLKNYSDGLSLKATILQEEGQLEEALKWHQAVLKFRMEVAGRRSPKYANSHFNVGNCLLELNQLADALYYLEKAQRIYELHRDSVIVNLQKTYGALGDCHSRMEKYETAQQFFQMALALPVVDDPGQETLVSKIKTIQANALFLEGKTMHAIRILSKVIGSQENSEYIDSSIYAMNLYQLGRFWESMGKLDIAKEFSLKCFKVVENLSFVNPKKAGQTHLNLANGLRDRGEFQLAFVHYEKALVAFRNIEKLLQDARLQYARCLRFYGDFQKAVNVLNKVLVFYGSSDWANSREMGVALADFGFCNMDRGAAEENLEHFNMAIQFFEESLKVLENLQSETGQLSKIYNQLGLAFLKIGKLKNAETQFIKALSLTSERAVGFLAMIHHNLGLLEKENGDSKKAFTYMNRALTLLENSAISFPYEGIQIHTTLAQIWTDIAFTASNRTNWDNVLHHSQKAIEGLQKLKGSFQDLTSEMDLNHLFYDVYSLQIEALVALSELFPEEGFLETAFAFIESYKGNLLQKLNAEEKEIEKSARTIKDIQNNLAGDQTFIECHWGNDRIYLFVINAEAYAIHKIENPSKIQNQIETLFRNCNQRPDYKGLEQNPIANEIVELSLELYNNIIDPIEDELKPLVHIVPDAWLYFLPFDLLIKEAYKDPSRFRLHEYFFQKYAVNLHFSAASFLQKIQTKSVVSQTKKMLAIAPSFKRRKDFTNIEFNLIEADMAHDIMGGDQWSGEYVFESDFISKAPDYQIILLATHGVMDNSHPNASYLVFSKPEKEEDTGFLTVGEIRAIPLQAELVILSACRTLDGPFYRGEGLLGVAHAFFSAGAKSLVASLWNVDDQKTSRLMESYYQNLKAGELKPVALNKAKRAYLDGIESVGEKSHPFYWAGFMAFGEANELKHTSKGFACRWVLVLGLFGVLIWWGRKKWFGK